jgi:hypothetical protein
MDSPKPDHALPLDYARPDPAEYRWRLAGRVARGMLGIVVIVCVVLPVLKYGCYMAVPHARAILSGSGRQVEFTYHDYFSGPQKVKGTLVGSKFCWHDNTWGFFHLQVTVRWANVPISGGGVSSGSVTTALEPHQVKRVKFLDAPVGR